MVPISSLVGTSRNAGYSTVSPVIQSWPCSCPAQERAKPTTGPVIGSLPTGPCRHGVAVIVMVSLPGASRVVVPHGASPTQWLPSLAAAFLVVIVVPHVGSRAAADGSRLSPWWWWLTSTASIGPRSPAAIEGPTSLR